MKDRAKYSAELLFAVYTGAALVLLAVLLLVAPPDGNNHAQFLELLGRLHPLSVHLPIALLIFLPLLEIAGRNPKFSHVQAAARFTLGVTLVGAIAAAGLGWCLARAGGYAGTTITQHMWGAVAVGALSWVCWVLRRNPARERLYLGALALAVLAASFTGYRGGQLTHGENHLTELLPSPLRNWLGVPGKEAAGSSSAVDAGTWYGAQLRPIFEQHCVTCHGPSKQKAGLRLDSFSGLMRGGKHGAVLKPGDAKSSELFRRITLPPGDEDAMPPENRRPLSPAEIAVIEQWIAGGASATQPNPGGAPTPVAGAPVEVTILEISPAAVSAERAQLASAVAQLQQKLPNVVGYESRGSAQLTVQAAWMRARFGDEQVAALAPLAERIVLADFSSTAITGHSASAMAGMKNLRTLRLMHTSTTDATVQALTSLQKLESLSLFDTQVTPAALAALARMPSLKRVYVGSTKISPASAVPQELGHKLIF
ncbi:MAG: hypothetical protein JST79_07775 [Acidobacteria bacterium]|nr:hypothetical protein [Acidobacteriota bacterium]